MRKGPKQVDPRAYEELRKLPLYQCVFSPHTKDSQTSDRSPLTPQRDLLDLRDISRRGASGDDLIRQVLKNN